MIQTTSRKPQQGREVSQMGGDRASPRLIVVIFEKSKHFRKTRVVIHRYERLIQCVDVGDVEQECA